MAKLKQRPSSGLSIMATYLDKEVLPTLYGKRMGFAMMIFEFGDSGQIDYVSNADRADMIVAVKEWLANMEGRIIQTDTKQ